MNWDIVNLVILSISFIGLFVLAAYPIIQFICLLGLVSTFWISYYNKSDRLGDLSEIVAKVDEIAMGIF